MDFASMAMQWMATYALLDRLLPPPLRQWIDRQLEALWDWLLLCSNPRRAARTVKLKVPEKYNGYNVNHFYRHALRYLASLHEALQAQDNLEVIREEDEEDEDGDGKDGEDGDKTGSTYFRLPHGEVLDDRFEGVVVRWRRQKDADGGASNDSDDNDNNNGKECITLEFAGADRRAIVPHYLNHISRTALEMQHRRTQLYLYHNHGSSGSSASWDCVAFNHPSTFENLALDPELRRRIVDDLRSFCGSQRAYRRLGRAWKRGYLLHGPPGTGKTSLVAAIANLLHYDVYDLELTSVRDNAQLKSLLIDTSRKSLVVIEDIDCAFASRGNASPPPTSSSNDSKKSRRGDDDDGDKDGEGVDDDGDKDGRGGRSSRGIGSSSFTLSGLLNFADGLWSGCAEERIFIFTTNFKERLDPALLRPGRMDMHIHLSYRSMPVVEQLANNYLGLRAHSHPQLFAQLETVVKAGRHSISPAALAEIFISHYHADRPELALQAALQAFEQSSSSSSSSSSCASTYT
jgi:chaperone BCS1